MGNTVGESIVAVVAIVTRLILALLEVATIS